MVMMQKAILADLNALKTLDNEGLTALWQQIFRDMPRPRSQDLAIRKIAWHVQEKAHGGLSTKTRGKLDRMITGKTQQPINKYELTPQTRLEREWNGRTYTVHITGKNRYEFDGRVYRSLSAIAKEITGAHWSGPLFFGLRKQNGTG